MERQQLKWFASAVLTALGGLGLAALADPVAARWGVVLNGVGCIVFLFGCVLGIPVATGIAILRYRLYDIDVVINRTLVYGSLTAALAATYVGSILLLRVLLSPVTGSPTSPSQAPRWWWRQSSVLHGRASRHLSTDASTAVATTLCTRSRTSPRGCATSSTSTRSAADLCTTADQTMQPAHVSLWLRQAR